MKLLKRAPRVHNLEEPRRLKVSINEPALREKLPSDLHLEAIREAKEYLFQNENTLRRIDKSSKP